ncbi:MAG: Outer membrane protein assembly factor BamA [Candidatus Marinimicrobia bacterium]|nr:Outer membrane protein assembly factor BamA [Candidatus Neomarinimicrobiota bacterium]
MYSKTLSIVFAIYCLFFWITPAFSQQMISPSTYRVKSIAINGNSVYPDEAIREEMNLHSGKLTTFGRGTEFNKRVLRLDVIQIEAFYRQHGYTNVSVSDSFHMGENRRVAVYLNISEGEQYFLEEMTIDGNVVFPIHQVRQYFDEVSIGEPYNPYALQQAIEDLQKAYENAGKPFANIQYQINAKGRETSAKITIQENQTVTVNNIRINGASEVQPYVVRREITLQRGDQYSGEEIRESQRRIYETGLFADVNIRPAPTTPDSQQVDLQVSVREREFRTVRFDMGAGQYQTTPSAEPIPALETSVEWGHRNLISSGRQLSASAGLLFNITEPGNSYPTTELRYTEPWLGHYRVPTTLRFFYERKTYDIASQPLDRWGTDITFQHTQRRELTLRSILTWQQISLPEGTALDPAAEGGQERSIAFLFRRDTRENFLYPRQGFVLTVEPKLFGGILGGQSNFYRVEVSVSKYWPVFSNMTLAGRINLGSLHNYSTNGDSIPDYELFRLGGATSVRGYQTDMFERQWNSTNENWIPQGDRVKLIMNLELRFPIIWQFGGEIFFDAGQIASNYGGQYGLDIVSISPTFGFGITFATPLGPARLDFGRKLRPETYGKDEQYEYDERDHLWRVNLGLQYAF